MIIDNFDTSDKHALDIMVNMYMKRGKDAQLIIRSQPMYFFLRKPGQNSRICVMLNQFDLSIQIMCDLKQVHSNLKFYKN